MRYSVPVFLITAGLVAVTTPVLSAQVLNEDLRILASEGSELDRFGKAIAIDNSIVAVGAPQDDVKGLDTGSVYIFDAVTGAEIAKLFPADGVMNDRFGSAVAIDYGIVAVAAILADDNGDRSGSAYVFNALTGEQIAKLLPSDGAEGDRFGRSIAIDNGVVVVGADSDDDLGEDSGSVYLFNASTGEQIHKLNPSDGAAGDTFGNSVAIDQGIIAIGARGDDEGEEGAGSVYLFDVATGAQIAKLIPRDPSYRKRFGTSVALTNGIVAIGANGDYEFGVNSGAAYLFDTATGEQLHKLIADRPAEEDEFGIAVDIDYNTVVVAAPWDEENGSNAGAAFLFDITTGQQITKLLASDGMFGDEFGTSVALANGVVAVGADGDDENGPNSGSAYLYGVKCLQLAVDNLTAGERAIFRIAGGTPGAKAVTVYGTAAGLTFVNGYADYCATLGIKGVNQNRVIGGLNRTFDADGEMAFGVNIPGNASGWRLFFQSAQKGTCPDECMSNLIEATVQ